MNLSDYFHQLQRFVRLRNEQVNANGRLLRIESIDITPVRERLAEMAAQVGAASYVVDPLPRPGLADRQPGDRHDAVHAHLAPDRHEHDAGDDHRDRSRSCPMTLITDTWRQLVERRLWPIALLLLAALVAVPVLLASNPAPASASSTTTAS